MDRELFEILENLHSSDVGRNYPLYSHFGPNKDWKIKEDNLSEFWRGYCRLLDEDFDKTFSLAEVPTTNMPIVVDFLFRFPTDKAGDEPYGNELVYLLVQVCQEEIGKLFNVVTTDKTEYICCYLESENMWQETSVDKSYECIKIRLQFPFCHVNVELQETILRANIVKRLESCNAKSLFPVGPVGSWDEIVGQGTVTSPLTMYGSSEFENQPKLQLNHIWHKITREQFNAFAEDGMSDFEELDWDLLFDSRNHVHDRNRLINRNIFLDNDNTEYWLPFYLSIGYWTEVTHLKKSTPTNIRMKRKSSISPLKKSRKSHQSHQSRRSPGHSHGDDISSSTELEGDPLHICEELLPILDEKRFILAPFWEDIAKALHHSSGGTSYGLNILQKYTKDYCPERLTQIKDFYRTCNKSRITVKTIAWYAREDNPEEYADWHNAWCLKSMNQALSCLDNDVAKCFYKFYWLDYLCTCNGTSIRWWSFNKHRWHDISKGIRLKGRISRDFVRQFERMRISLCRQIQESNDEHFRSKGESNLKKIASLIRRLKSTAPKGKIIVEAIEFFLHDDFECWIDDNDNLTGVENGIMEINKNDCHFRTGKPEDFITKTAIASYDSSFTHDHPLVVECLEWIHQVFPDKALAHHFLKYCASFLKSGNREKFLVIFSGEGDNSKSMICKLFGLFGGYCVRLPVTCITQGRQRSSGPNPEMARAKSAKIAIMQEPEDEDVLKGGIVKDTTGGEPFFARFLNDNGGEIRNTFKLILMCNQIPTFTNPGRALKNRVRIFPFLSTWVDHAPVDPDEQYKRRIFQKDEHFEDRIPLLQPAFLWLLKEYYPIYATEKLIDPPIIAEHTDRYWKENDVYEQYISDRICQAKTETGDIDARASLTLTQIFNDFKLFFHENYPSAVVPDRKIVKTNFTSRFGVLKGRAWHGIRFQQSLVNLPSLTMGVGMGVGSMGSSGSGTLGI